MKNRDIVLSFRRFRRSLGEELQQAITAENGKNE